MPKIPVYEAQVSAGPVPQTPKATADDFGAMTSEAIVGAAQAGLGLAETVVKARRAAEADRGVADATREFDAFKRMSLEDDDPATLPDRLTQQFGATEAKYRAMSDGDYRDAALGVFTSVGPTLLATTRNNAAKREVALRQGDLNSDTDLYVGQAAGASNDLERQIYVNLNKTAIARAHEAGYISREDALARMRTLPGQIEEKQVAALIERDPAAALTALDDKQQFRTLDPAVRDLQRGRAMLGRQKADFATVSAVQQGLTDGTKGQYDIDRLFDDGAIGEATRDWLNTQFKKATTEREETADGQNRVQSVLDNGGKLDPKKAKDRAAVDAHHDAVVAPANPDSPTLVAYIRRIGVVPTKVGQSIRGGLASDDPQQVVSAASLIQELDKSDGKLAHGFGAARLRYAKAVMDGVDGALSPERAVELATKRFGQPDASDDDGTQIADAERGTADESEKTKDGEAEDDSNARGVSGDDTKVGNGSSAKDDSATAGSDTSGSASETVGPEIAPVGGTEDAGKGAPPKEGLLNRAGRDVISGVKEAPEQAKGGVYDAVRETLETLDSLFRWKWSNRASLGKWLGLIDEDAPDGPSGETPFESAANAIPEVPPADSVTGGVIRGIAQFLFSYFAGSKGAGAGLKVLGAGGRAARLAKPLIGGAFADAIARDPAEQNLMNLIEEHTELKIPVLEYLVARDDDSEAEARFKKALEGILLGPVSEAAIRPLIEGLGLAVKAIKAKRRALRESGLSDEEVIRREQQMLLDARRKVEAEVGHLKKDPTAPLPPPGEVLATLTPESIGEVVVARGRLIRQGDELVVPRAGGEGFTKIVISHPSVIDEDLLALPRILRERIPAEAKPKDAPTQWAWRVRRLDKNGREVEINYVIKRLTGTDDRNHLLTVYVETDPRKFRNVSGRVPGRADP